jgi:hypothetical protein
MIHKTVARGLLLVSWICVHWMKEITPKNVIRYVKMQGISINVKWWRISGIRTASFIIFKEIVAYRSILGRELMAWQWSL